MSYSKSETNKLTKKERFSNSHARRRRRRFSKGGLYIESPTMYVSMRTLDATHSVCDLCNNTSGVARILGKGGLLSGAKRPKNFAGPRLVS